MVAATSAHSAKLEKSIRQFCVPFSRVEGRRARDWWVARWMGKEKGKREQAGHRRRGKAQSIVTLLYYVIQ